MRQRKLYQLLELLDKEDIRSFRAYLSNPHFNSSKTLIGFFDLWKKRILDRKGEKELTVEEFLKGTDIQRRRMDKLCSKLYALACSYLSMNAFLENQDMQDEMLLEAVKKRDSAGKESLRHIERIYAQINQQDASATKILRSLLIQWEKAELTIKSRGTSSLWQENFQDLHELLDQYYQLQKLKLLSASYNVKKIFNQDDPDRDAAFIESLRESRASSALAPLSRAYYLTIRMLQSEDGESYFKELLNLLDENASSFVPAAALDLYGYALNHCIRSANAGKGEFQEHASVLYMQLLENKLILQKGELLPQQFKNIVALQCRLGKLDWVRDFIDEFGIYLPSESRVNAVRYNEAVLSFYQKDYAHAIEQLKAVTTTMTDDVFYGLDARAFLWKAYFEHMAHLTMDEVDEMYRLYDAFRLFIERNEKISVSHKRSYRNFIREFKRFIEILRREPVTRKQVEALFEDVSGIPFLANKSWFLEKIEGSLKGLPMV